MPRSITEDDSGTGTISTLVIARAVAGAGGWCTLYEMIFQIAFLIVAIVAQLSPPNSSGVAMGHLHYKVRDVEANMKFWVALGGKPSKFGTTDVVKFPDALVLLEQGNPTAGS